MPLPTVTVTPGTGTTINTLPNAGQALAAESLPVVLPAAQEAALKVLAAGTADIGKVDATGTKVTAATIPTGGAGFLGWLSAVWYQLTQVLTTVRNAATSGGWAPRHALSAASNNATNIKASAGQVGGWVFSNTNASTRYVKFYNKASAPAPASDAPVFVVAVPGGSTGAPTVVTSNEAVGLEFTTGISFAVVANMSDTDNTSVTAGDMSIDIKWK